jgi:hypothetical protein
MILLTQIEEIGADIGEPDCKLTEPYLVKDSPIEGAFPTIEPWLVSYTDQNTFMLHSDKILTITDPNSRLLNLYKDLTK